MSNSIHQFKVAGIEGAEINFADYAGKKMLIVNVASECGYTPQYQQLQELYEEFQDRLVVIGVPSNDFGGQEPGTNAEIRAFCTTRYGVTFPQTAKLSIRKSPHELYQWLTTKAKNGVMNSVVKWNFHKYFIDEQGHLINSFSSGVSPFDDQIIGQLTA
ncbi:MAG: glutathione peroxidase [Bacteroidota bacterium]